MDVEQPGQALGDGGKGQTEDSKRMELRALISTCFEENAVVKVGRKKLESELRILVRARERGIN